MWKQWVNAILALAVIATPFLGLTTTALMWTLVVAGLLIAALSLWTAGEVSSDEYARLAHSTA